MTAVRNGATQPATEFHNVGTSRNSGTQQQQPQQQTAAPPLDPWAQAADEARARASQPTQSQHAAPAAAPAAQSPFVDSAPRDAPTAPSGLPNGWNQQPAEPFTPPNRPTQGNGFVPPGANPHTRVQYMGTQRPSTARMRASANSTGRP